MNSFSKIVDIVHLKKGIMYSLQFFSLCPPKLVFSMKIYRISFAYFRWKHGFGWYKQLCLVFAVISCIVESTSCQLFMRSLQTPEW